MSKYFKKPNIFTPLILIVGFALAFRLVNIVTYKDTPASQVGTVKSASAVEGEHAASSEEPPPLTKEDLKKAVDETAKAADALPSDGKKDVEPGDSIKPPPGPVAPSPSFSSSELDVLQSLSKRREEIDKREKTLADREALLTAAGQEIDRKVTELNKLKADMENLLGAQQKAEDGQIMSLVKIYENMKPKEAATIFDQLDMNILLEVISRMNERKVSPILAGMSPQKAKDVTIKLAEQRKLPADKKSAPTPPAQ